MCSFEFKALSNNCKEGVLDHHTMLPSALQPTAARKPVSFCPVSSGGGLAKQQTCAAEDSAPQFPAAALPARQRHHHSCGPVLGRRHLHDLQGPAEGLRRLQGFTSTACWLSPSPGGRTAPPVQVLLIYLEACHIRLSKIS